MQKNIFLTFAAIFMAVSSMSSVCMENELATTEKPITIEVDLYLKKGTPILHDSYDKKSDAHFWQLWNTDGEINKSSYVVKKALFYSRSNNQIPNSAIVYCWTQIVPNNLPKSTQPNPSITTANEAHDLPYLLNKFASTCPDHIVERLEKEKTITFIGTKFEKPVTMTMKLQHIEDNSTAASQTHQQNALDPITQAHYLSLAESNLQPIQNNSDNTSNTSPNTSNQNTNKIPVDCALESLDNRVKEFGKLIDNLEEDANPTFTKTKIFGLTAVGLFTAYLAYLWHNNQLNTEFFNTQLSRINDFIQQLKK